MTKLRLLDLFSGAGGATRGYQNAGFEVWGVDNRPQPRYVGEHFTQADVFELEPWFLSGFDAVHASPPCQAYSTVSGRALKGQWRRYPDLIQPTRELLRSSELLYVIENVEGAPLLSPARLCGSWFGLDVRRHRLFETNWPLMSTPCSHHWQQPRFRSLDSRQRVAAAVVGVHGHLNYAGERVVRERAMGIDWMEPAELNESIPPAYTKLVGYQLRQHLERAAA